MNDLKSNEAMQAFGGIAAVDSLKSEDSSKIRQLTEVLPQQPSQEEDCVQDCQSDDCEPNCQSDDCEMPKYQCHKKVWALKIKTVTIDGEGEDRETDGSATITPEESGYGPFKVDREYVHKHKPQAGGYYVVYEDGYKSFSPAEAFENGYSRI